MHYIQARQKIKRGKIYPFYLFCGPEKYLQEIILQEILSSLHQKGKDFFLEKLEGDKLSLPGLLERLGQMTIFSEGRLLWVEDSPYFSAKKKAVQAVGKKKAASKRGWPAGEKELVSFLQEKEATDLVLVFSVSGVDRRRKLVKIIEEEGRLVEFPLLQGATLQKWVKDELFLAEKRIEEKALQELLIQVGENLQILKRELEKIVTYLGEEKTVTRTLISRLVPESSQGNIFHLVEAMGRQDIERALFHLHKLLQQNEPPLVILAMVARQYRLFHQYLTLYADKTPREIASALKLPPFIIKELAGQAQNYTPALLTLITTHIQKIDLGIKTGRYDAKEALEKLVLQLTATAGYFVENEAKPLMF